MSISVADHRAGPLPRPVVGVDPLFDHGPDAMVELAHRFGRYRTYGTHEPIRIDIGPHLHQRHDSVRHFLRTGGLQHAQEDAATLAARTAYFREEYAYGADERIDGIGAFLWSPRLAEAAREVHGRPVIEPAIAYANLMVPGQELAVHTDVPEFRGVDRKQVPQWLLVVMHHSGLFEPWRLHIATGIAWFHDSRHGGLAYWPDGPDAPVRRRRIAANTALVLDTDSVFHGVERVADDGDDVVPPVGPGATLEATDDGQAIGGQAGGSQWVLRDAGGAPTATYHWDELRFSVSWKAYCFADDDEREAWRSHRDDLDLLTIIGRLVDDLVRRGIVDDPTEAVNADLGLTLIDTYVRFPA